MFWVGGRKYEYVSHQTKVCLICSQIWSLSQTNIFFFLSLWLEHFCGSDNNDLHILDTIVKLTNYWKEINEFGKTLGIWSVATVRVQSHQPYSLVMIHHCADPWSFAAYKLLYTHTLAHTLDVISKLICCVESTKKRAITVKQNNFFRNNLVLSSKSNDGKLKIKLNVLAGKYSTLIWCLIRKYTFVTLLELFIEHITCFPTDSS